VSESLDDLKEFEDAILKASAGQYVLKLFVSGSSPRSTKAVANIRSICEEYLSGRYELEIIDVYQQPELVQSNQLLAAPTLVKEKPDPLRKVVGDMADRDFVLLSLNIQKA